MRKLKIILKGIVLLSIYTLTLTSCLKDDTEEKIAEHNRKMEAMKVTYGISEDEMIGDGIYVHYTFETDTTTIAPVRAVPSDYVVVDLEGYDSDGIIFDVTDSAVAEQENVYNDELVYGPIRVNINNAYIGLYKAFQEVPEGWSATILIPHDQFAGGYIPVVYKVKLYRVIDDFELYLDTTYQNYKELMGLDSAKFRTTFDSVYSKIIDPGDTTTEAGIEAGETVTMQLHGYYVETDTAYVDGFPGRSFFPFDDGSDTIEFVKGETYFPVTEIVNEIVDIMHIGEEREVLTPAEYAYGEDGFVHPYVGVYLVPPDMPLHYTLKLISVSEE